MTNTQRAVFLDYTSLDLGDLDLDPLRRAFGDVQLCADTTPANVIERLQGARVAISNKVVLNAQTLAACPELKLILVAATGTNNVDLEAARALGITVANCQGYGTPSVAQHTLGLLLALATRLVDYNKAVADGQWQQAKQFCLLDFPIVELEGKTLGLFGHGEEVRSQLVAEAQHRVRKGGGMVGAGVEEPRRAVQAGVPLAGR
ncbi:MAG: glycerate dehydrogenase, partial [Pseudomonas sp.]|nr:glycerate dehydrogenase [Pseudomonas sp.]